MKNNLKVLFIQLCVLAIGCFIGEAVFGLPKWLGLVIAGLMFYLVFFIIQIKGAMSNIKDEVSSDGIAGARICGVFISAILLAFILGIYVYQAANIAMTIAGVVLLILQRRKIKRFFFENRWENNFWLVYFGIAFIICGVFSVFACLANYFSKASCYILFASYCGCKADIRDLRSNFFRSLFPI